MQLKEEKFLGFRSGTGDRYTSVLIFSFLSRQEAAVQIDTPQKNAYREFFPQTYIIRQGKTSQVPMLQGEKCVDVCEPAIDVWEWLTTDPKSQFFNPYSYVGGNPVNMVDPTGEEGTYVFSDASGMGWTLSIDVGSVGTHAEGGGSTAATYSASGSSVGIYGHGSSYTGFVNIQGDAEAYNGGSPAFTGFTPSVQPTISSTPTVQFYTEAYDSPSNKNSDERSLLSRVLDLGDPEVVFNNARSGQYDTKLKKLQAGYKRLFVK